jgi:hypothetical protein
VLRLHIEGAAEKPFHRSSNMSVDDPRYQPVSATWATVDKPAITRDEAERAARLLYRKFGKKAESVHQRFDMKFTGKARRCWISSKPNVGLNRGWERLVHDVSHRIFDKRCPHLRPHHSAHSHLEAEIAAFVVASGWLQGKLKPPQKSKPAPDQVRALKIARMDAALARWDTKQRRAVNAIRKLKTQRRRLERAL